MKLTHATAMIPMGMYHLPRENGPGWSRLRPDVIRRKIGTVYETYSPMTDALVTRHSVNERAGQRLLERQLTQRATTARSRRSRAARTRPREP